MCFSCDVLKTYTHDIFKKLALIINIFKLYPYKKKDGLEHQGGVSQNLSSVTNDNLCYKLLKSLLLIGYQQILSLIFVICHWKKDFVKHSPGLRIVRRFS